jgi:hypothetical protein
VHKDGLDLALDEVRHEEVAHRAVVSSCYGKASSQLEVGGLKVAVDSSTELEEEGVDEDGAGLASATGGCVN